MSKPYATYIIGGSAGALAFVVIVIGIIWFCKSHCKYFSNKNSETGSSDPSAQAEWNRGGGASSSGGQPLFGPQGARQFSEEELAQATKQFSENNLIGYGNFGQVYKGLLRDTVVAIKRRPGNPRQAFVAEVTYLSEIRHRHVVSLLGYCQESGYQMLVYEYLPNDSMCNHLYDTGVESSTRLEFKQRLSIALGAARGLCHLHSLKPPLVHKNFKTANVLVDENFNAKVADAGISKLLEKVEEAGPSHTSRVSVFLDPEVGVSGTFTDASDIYSFGVFLLELVTGQEALYVDSLGSNESLIQWVRSRLSSNTFVDHRLLGSFTAEGMRDLIRLMLKCMSFPGRSRPKTEMVVTELERIHEKEMELTTVMGEGTATITLGSELFMSK
ncbi:putative serine/threonine-protein kinase [Carica papaya]|uniref:putative serine/threonine-protein kinase n=1 Tax=Carica papaya TaxID=3649 RepID=UPI000B8D012B|nr:putative serine/threonine-protein kinase [Carica papaya]XP_021905059.1 putative serine/threonine-protein kinase [Carica papaya]XP_021905060.1 putative serine/threonine-protein kinase [Carica papaya]XP_021905061.1 putative serine/threonine-protein kinase [Carica papaya]XP_021905062.1 putative serine/threonine-protein kinase [Carica papaya]XP_021905063.1 putative serine/threonine-protein kinase [Carica papaya]XP_021905064.1 putative serine/threonine-protein kinase [Carica papaya]